MDYDYSRRYQGVYPVTKTVPSAVVLMDSAMHPPYERFSEHATHRSNPDNGIRKERHGRGTFWTLPRRNNLIVSFLVILFLLMLGVTNGSDIDDCASSPCQNDGTCMDEIDAYTCTCVGGYTGTNCETDIDECASSPCENDGTCMDEIDAYNCTCIGGYTGTNCETDINECSSQPCFNEATCIDLIDGYNCTCEAGFEGVHCETDIDDCASNPCANGGTCNDQINGYNCTCVSGYKQLYCESVFLRYGVAEGDILLQGHPTEYYGPFTVGKDYPLLNEIYISPKGFITIDEAPAILTPCPGSNDYIAQNYVAALLMDYTTSLDTNGRIYAREITGDKEGDAADLTDLVTDANLYYADNGNATDSVVEWAFVVTWENMTYTGGDTTTKTNTFQVVLIRDQYIDILVSFSYGKLEVPPEGDCDYAIEWYIWNYLYLNESSSDYIDPNHRRHPRQYREYYGYDDLTGDVGLGILSHETNLEQGIPGQYIYKLFDHYFSSWTVSSD